MLPPIAAPPLGACTPSPAFVLPYLGCAQLIGLGVDVISLPRFATAWQRHPQSWLPRLFTPAERALGGQTITPRAIAFYAKRFAAKEACAKAFGQGIGRHIGFQDISITRTPAGQPLLTLSSVVQQAWVRLQAQAQKQDPSQQDDFSQTPNLAQVLDPAESVPAKNHLLDGEIRGAVSLTDEPPYGLAFVVLSWMPKEPSCHG